MSSSIIYDKAFSFAIKIVRLYKELCEDKREYILSKQLIRSGTSIGANIKEALDGQSKKDFIAKLCIALKEASEKEYWLELLMSTGFIGKENGGILLEEAGEIHKILNSIILTSKENIKKVKIKDSPLSTLNSQLDWER